MFTEFYRCLTSFPEDKFVANDKLSQSVLNSLRDPVCLNIPNIFCKDAPAECKKCAQVICAKCIEMTLKSDAKCPSCQDILQVRKMNRYLRQILANMKMRCHLHANGCSVALPLEELIKHENQCDFECVQCPKQCGKRVIRKYSDDHIENECPLEHVRCLYKGCNVQLPRDQLRKHHNECPFRLQVDLTRTSIPDEEGKTFDSAEVILCYDSDSDDEQDLDDLSERNSAEKGLKLGFHNLKDCIDPSDNPVSKCTNEGCGTSTVYAELIRNHEKICSYKIEPCMNRKYGCTYSGNQYGLISHQLKCPFSKPLVEKKENLSAKEKSEKSGDVANDKIEGFEVNTGEDNKEYAFPIKKHSCQY